MTAQSSLDHHGNFLTHPFAEVLAEISQARLTGSLRITSGERKIIVYFKTGRVAYAVSNSVSYRLLEILLEQKLEPSVVGDLPKFSSDLEFADILNSRAIFLKSETDQFIVEQVQSILIDTLDWKTAEWHFSPLSVCLRDGVKFNIATEQILLNFGRCISIDNLLTRFRTLKESFRVSANDASPFDLQPHESLTLSRFNEEPKPIEEIITMNSMSETTAIKSIYTLWLAGCSNARNGIRRFPTTKSAPFETQISKFARKHSNLRRKLSTLRRGPPASLRTKPPYQLRRPSCRSRNISKGSKVHKLTTTCSESTAKPKPPRSNRLTSRSRKCSIRTSFTPSAAISCVGFSRHLPSSPSRTRP